MLDPQSISDSVKTLEANGISDFAKPQEPVKNVVIILGPPNSDGVSLKMASDIMARSLKEKGAKVTVIGDGIHELSKEKIAEELGKIKEPSTLLVLAHGAKVNNNLSLHLNNNSDGFPSTDIFPAVNQNFKDGGVLIFACHGESVFDRQSNIDMLPKGTQVRACSGKDSNTIVGDIILACGNSNNSRNEIKDFSAANLQYNFIKNGYGSMSHMFDNPENRPDVPSYIGIAGGSITDFEKSLKELKGRDFNREERKYIQEELVAIFGKDVNVKELLKKIHDGISPDDKDYKSAVIVADIINKKDGRYEKASNYDAKDIGKPPTTHSDELLEKLQKFLKEKN